MTDTYIDLFLAFFIPNIIGYGGGPAIIPLIEAQVIGHYGWMSAHEFAEILALGNALPSPIATKMAGYIGFQIAGIPGATIAVFATVAPSLILMISALSLLYRYRNSPRVKALSQWVLPVIAALMLILSAKLIISGSLIGWAQFAMLVLIAGALLDKLKVHPTLVIIAGLIYGALFLG